MALCGYKDWRYDFVTYARYVCFNWLGLDLTHQNFRISTWACSGLSSRYQHSLSLFLRSEGVDEITRWSKSYLITSCVVPSVRLAFETFCRPRSGEKYTRFLLEVGIFKMDCNFTLLISDETDCEARRNAFMPLKSKNGLIFLTQRLSAAKGSCWSIESFPHPSKLLDHLLLLLFNCLILISADWTCRPQPIELPSQNSLPRDNIL